MDNIYILTTVHISALYITRKRTVGWFPTFLKAREIVVNNEGDIYEAGHYNHCVIEEVPSGLYPQIPNTDNEGWFAWSSVDEQYVLVSKPKEIENLHNLHSMGDLVTWCGEGEVMR